MPTGGRRRAVVIGLDGVPASYLEERVAAGPLAETLTSAHLSACFGVALKVASDGGRWTCRAVTT